MAARLAPEPTADDVITVLRRLRLRAPLVQCLTNSVATNISANVLLALGAAPAMVDIPDEAGEFAPVADGVLVNPGTPGAEARAAMLEAAAGARLAGTPWVLDPVAVGALSVRTRLAHELLRHGPAVVRGNASEVLALAGGGAGGRGVDATDGVEDAIEVSQEFAREHSCVVAVSGPVDVLTDGTRTWRLANGHPWLTQMTGGGCALGAVMAACAGMHTDPLVAAASATAVYTVAAEVAAETAHGPGTFAVHLLDALAALTADDVRRLFRPLPAGAPG
jgi:hydroxyethylthiazole kinase